jgi:hypothetical protein
MRVQYLDYESIISYFNQFECRYIYWLFVGIQVHYFLLNVYLLIFDRCKNYYHFIENNGINTIFNKWRDYILFALFEQLYINSLKNISEYYFNFNSQFTKIMVCIIYGMLRAVYMSNGNYIAKILQIIFSFSMLMIYYNFNELCRLYINMYINSVYFIMYIITYMTIYSHQTDYLVKLSLKSKKNE